MTVPIDKPALYSDLQMRVSLPEKTIAQYAEAMRQGSEFPPIECAELDGELIVFDGFLRKHAYLLCGVAQIEVRIYTVESRDQIILMAVKANAHDFLKRSNADKEHSVRQLLDTEMGKTMSSVDIANAAGVHINTVIRFRERQTKSGVSITKGNSESPSKVKTSRGMRPRKYKKRKAKSAHVPHQPVRWPTREEKEAPPPELINQPHPDHPGLTYGQVHTKQHGFVQLFPAADKRRQDNVIHTREVVGRVRDIGIICRKVLPFMAKITVAEIIATLATMESKKWSRELGTYRDDLMTALPFIKALLEASKSDHGSA
jgi:hypothetical protein